MRLCSEEGCGKKYYARDYCQYHYNKFRVAGALPLLRKKFTSDNLRSPDLSEGLKASIVAWIRALPEPARKPKRGAA